jgi:histidine kinase
MKSFSSPLNQLRWRIVGAHLIVVVVGVVVVFVAAGILTQYFVPGSVEARLRDLVLAQDDAALAEATELLLDTFRSSIITAVLFAAAGAVIAGFISGLLLAREILRPLRDIANSSRRIADGRYSERVAVPGSDELALVAMNFNQMAEALESVEEKRVVLIGNVAHELRTPLAALAGYLEGLMDGLFPSEPETFHEMHLEVRRLNRLVDDLQALSRVETGQLSLQMHDFAISPVVERVSNQLRPQAEAKGITCELERPETGAEVHGDPDRVAQIIVNLIGNAIRYTPEGGRIRVAVAENASAVEVVVEDTGIGIPEEALPFVFERFYRVDQSRSRKSGGSGIGLTISRYLAWAMGAELTAESAGRGQGSTFRLSMVRAQPSLGS